MTNRSIFWHLNSGMGLTEISKTVTIYLRNFYKLKCPTVILFGKQSLISKRNRINRF